MTHTLDLGDIDRPLLICGGAYGNLEALQAFERWAALHGFAADSIVHTGDVAAYCADPSAAAAFVRERGWHSIKGNVEEQLATEAGDCACGFDEGSVCNALSQRWYAYASRQVSAADRRWMAGLPSSLRFTLNGRQVMVVHGAPGQTNRFMFESLDEAEFLDCLAAADADIVLAGHTGIPFTRRIGTAVWHNSGALGMPANDATPRVWISTVAPEATGIRFTHHALVYDHETAAGKVLAADLPDAYGHALRSGLWPSLDILPPPERAAAGHPISAMEVFVSEPTRAAV